MSVRLLPGPWACTGDRQGKYPSACPAQQQESILVWCMLLLENSKLHIQLPASSWHVQMPMAQGFCQWEMSNPTMTAATWLLS